MIFAKITLFVFSLISQLPKGLWATNPYIAPRIPDDGEGIGRLDAALERNA
jgi:hypothetical protein